MINYLVQNIHMDIIYSVHQCAWYALDPKFIHEIAILQIIFYLKEIQNMGLIIITTTDVMIDCYVDAYFAGFFSVEYPPDWRWVLSRKGFIFLFAGVMIYWLS